jgi:hypothetical protein
MYGTLFFFLVIASVLSLSSVMAQDNTQLTNVVILENDFESDIWTLTREGDEVDVSVDVTSPSGGRVDVYVISQNQFNGYPESSFTPALAREGITHTDFTFTVPDNQRYYIVIDNMDNSRASDTVPLGNVTVDYEYSNPLLEEAEDAFMTGVMYCVAGVVIIVAIIVIIVVIILVSGNKSPPPVPPAPYPPMQPYPQQPYQQPYQPPPPGVPPPYPPPPDRHPPPQ